MLANVESGRTKVTDEQIVGLQRAFGVRIILLFPKAVQELDDKYARRESDGL